MNWKARQLFSNREQGIMSGLDPIPMMGGGSVPYPGMQTGGPVMDHTHPELHSHSAPPSGPEYLPDYLANPDMVLFGAPTKRDALEYLDREQKMLQPSLPKMQEGGPVPPVPEEPSIEEQVAKLAKLKGISVPTARGQLLEATAAQQGMSLPPDVINQFAVGLISLHDALAQGTQNQESQQNERNLAQQEQLFFPGMQTGGMVGMDLFEEGDQDVNEALNMMATVTNPEVPDMPATNGATVVEETITEDQGPSNIEKEPFQRMAINVVEQASEIMQNEEYVNTAEIEEQVQGELNAIDEQYRLQTGATDSILTEDFLNLLDRITTIPKMQDGTTEDEATMMDIEAYIRNLGGGVAGDPEKVKEIIKTYKEASAGSVQAQEKLQALARRGAMLSGKSKQGGVSGLMDVLGQADLAEAEVLKPMPQQMSANEAAMDRLAMEIETGIYGGTKGSGMTAEGKNLLILQKVMAMPDSPQKEMFLDKFNIDTNTKLIKDYAVKIQSDLNRKTPSELKKWKRDNGYEEGATIAEIAVKEAQALSVALSGSSSTPTSTPKDPNDITD